MSRLFGTDGIRGQANRYPMDAETAVRVGRAVAVCFRGASNTAPVVVGRDTRKSGPMLESALVAGICSAGVDVFCAGVIPTPAVAVLTAQEGARAGIVISASHNPYEDNGIKIFDNSGYKLSDDRERELEQRILDDDWQRRQASSTSQTGIPVPLPDARRRYLEHLKRAFPRSEEPFSGISVVIDCANGATSEVAPLLFSELGMQCHVLSSTPDGTNINRGCGSEHPESVAAWISENGATAGLAFDGDGDRLVAVDETGGILSGDMILAVCADHFLRQQQSRGTAPVLVSTIMSNIGLTRALEKMGIRHERCAVGDREVVETMRRTGASIGGEDSGHLVFLENHTTGDGLLSALKLLEVVSRSGKPLSRLKRAMTAYPQILLAVPVREKPDLYSLVEVRNAIEAAESELGDRGRVVVRYSGTQPVCRVMVEGPTEEETRGHARRIASAVEKALG
ncbi:MAG: phosphoglucosamine mutase [Desulfobacteraceae bacterium]|nr:phosphoglucosamine mutase [Desulfobacteraceae bacterium]